ncbi:uncharacterized protein SCHCODRAFT_02594459 [Schizophyllum commune H4-8]|nr:uncharacterized protein SCHCODRAFT_02594459 [Schizophyllum commune H4-8]KAI5885144.1 hypothetical protein SCHCODRAFT_02594459 [Schizophyllum commune H4-8]
MHATTTKLHTCLCTTCKACVHARTAAIPKTVTSSAHILTQHEKSEFERKSKSDIASLVAYDDAILHMQQILERLNTDRQTLQDSMDSKRAMIGPIRRLPNEVLAMIISFTVLGTFSRHPDSTYIAHHLVLQVCRHWRDLGIATPHIWSKITLFPRVYDNWATILQLCLERSKAHSLQVHLSSDRTAPSNPARKSRERWRQSLHTDEMDAIDVLFKQSARWKYARLGGIILSDDGLIEEIPLELPLLTSLYLEKPDWFGNYSRCLPGKTFFNAPALKYARIENHRFENLCLQWGQLTRLHIVIRDMEENAEHVLSALRQCGLLYSLTFGARLAGITDTTPPVVLPLLRDLILKRYGQSILPALRAPALREIAFNPDGFSYGDEGVLEPIEALKHFGKDTIQHGTDMPSISRVEVPVYMSHALNWAEIFECYPGVTHLQLADWCNGGSGKACLSRFVRGSRIPCSNIGLVACFEDNRRLHQRPVKTM